MIKTQTITFIIYGHLILLPVCLWYICTICIQLRVCEFLFTVGIPDICNHNKSYSDVMNNIMLYIN